MSNYDTSLESDRERWIGGTDNAAETLPEHEPSGYEALPPTWRMQAMCGPG